MLRAIAEARRVAKGQLYFFNKMMEAKMLNEHDIKDFPGSPYAEEDFEKTQPVMEGVAATQAVYGYDIRRSAVSNQLYNVFAVNFMNEVLYPMVVDVSFDTALNYKLAYDSALDNGVAAVQQEKILTTGEHWGTILQLINK